MRNRLVGLLVFVALLGGATTATTVASATPADPSEGVAPDVLVTDDGQLIEAPDVLSGADGEAFRPQALVDELALGPAPSGPPAERVGAVSTESVIGADGRTQNPWPTSWPNSAIGQIHYSLAGFQRTCTGVLVDQNTVLTAGRCVHIGGVEDPDGWFEDLTFIPARDGEYGAALGVCGHTQLLTTVAWRASADESQNWGLIQLDCSAGHDAGWMGYRAESNDANLLGQSITVEGYPVDEPAGTQWYATDQVRSLTPELLFTQADTGPGQEGSPAFQTTGCNGACVLGIVTQPPHGSSAPHSTMNHGARITASRSSDIAFVAGANNTTRPANDDFTSSISLGEATSGTVTFDNTGGSREWNEPQHAGSYGVASVWYRWTAPTSGTVVMDTYPSQFNTVLAAYTGTSLTGLTQRAADDDGIEGTTLSEIRFPVTAGTTYRIAVDGQPAATAPGYLNWLLDSSAPAISISSPPVGASFTTGQHVVADYACTDEPGGSGVASCTGTVADGAPLDTTGTGTKTFTVTAVDQAGNQRQVSRTYSVTAADTTGPTIVITTPAQGAVYERGQAVIADYACSDPSSVSTCAGTVPDGSRLDTSTVGTRSFTVQATDGRGNPTQLTRTYTVVRHRADAHIRRTADTAFVGDGIVNATGLNQTRSSPVGPRGSASFVVRIQNDGSVTDGFLVRGPASNRAFAVRYFVGPTEVSAAVKAGTYRTPDRAPGGSSNLRVVLTAKVGAVRGQSMTAALTVRSVARPAALDVVRAVATRV